jgi:hypothetical protein
MKEVVQLEDEKWRLGAKHLNAFNTVISQLLSIDIEIYDEYKCIILCSLYQTLEIV